MVNKTVETFLYYIEVAGLCNLKCPSCPNGNRQDAAKAHGFMPMALFEEIIKKIISESPGINTLIHLYNWGEPTLHPELPQLMNIVHQYGLIPHLSSNLVSPLNLKAIVKARPGSFRISLSGYNPQTYRQTHVGGDIWMVKSNAYKLRALMNQYQIDFPVHFCYHQYLHNFKEDLDQLRHLAEELDFTVLPIWAQLFPLEKMLDYYNGLIRPEDNPVLDLLVLNPEDYKTISSKKRAAFTDCCLRSHQTAIDFDGAVPACCAVYDRENYLDQSFLDLSHDQIQAQKYQLPICRHCRHHAIDLSYLYADADGINRHAQYRLQQRSSMNLSCLK